MKKVILIVVIILSFIFSAYISFLIKSKYDEKVREEALINKIKEHYSNKVITLKQTKLYDVKHKEIGYTRENVILELEIKIIKNYKDVYFKIKDSDYYVIYSDVLPTNEEIAKEKNNYINYGIKITTNDNYDLIKEEKVIYHFDVPSNYEVLVNKKESYMIFFANNIYEIKKSDIKEKQIYDVENASKMAVLNYHFFYDPEKESCKEDICESVNKFREQLDYLKEEGFKTVTIEEFRAWMYKEIQLPKKSVLITIDDGAMGTSNINGNILIPLLEEYDMHATLFLVTKWWDKENYYSPNIDVQSHGYDLHKKGKCGTARAICISKKELVEDLNTSINLVDDATAFAYPFFAYNKKIISGVKEAGFKIAFIGGFKKASRDGDKYTIPRYEIINSIDINTFKNYVN